MKRLRQFAVLAVVALGSMLCAACRTARPLPPADFSSPGWGVHQGQAVWKPSKKRPELAGDLLFATNANGNFVIQFTKTPFNMVAAEVENGEWQINFGGGKYSWGGHGRPPKRFSWFQLPRALAGADPAPSWTFTKKPDDSWRLENKRTGESLEGVIFP